MYEKHESFVEPEDKSVKLWRYFDITKFDSMLDKRELYFASPDQQDDPYEGKFPDTDVENMESKNDSILNNDHSLSLPGKKEQKKYMMRLDTNYYVRENIVFSCWNENEVECDLMWKSYAPGGEGVVVQTTFSKLCDCFADEPNKIMIGKVKYSDYVTGTIDSDDIFAVFLSKRSYYKNDREIRAVRFGNPSGFGVSLETLIENVVVSPTATPSFYESVKSKMEEHGLPNIDVLKSKLSKKPLY